MSQGKNHDEQIAATRWELAVLIGPCTEEEATDLMLELDDVTNERFGSVWSAQRVEDDDA